METTIPFSKGYSDHEIVSVKQSQDWSHTINRWIDVSPAVKLKVTVRSLTGEDRNLTVTPEADPDLYRRAQEQFEQEQESLTNSSHPIRVYAKDSSGGVMAVHYEDEGGSHVKVALGNASYLSVVRMMTGEDRCKVSDDVSNLSEGLRRDTRRIPSVSALQSGSWAPGGLDRSDTTSFLYPQSKTGGKVPVQVRCMLDHPEGTVTGAQVTAGIHDPRAASKDMESVATMAKELRSIASRTEASMSAAKSGSAYGSSASSAVASVQPTQDDKSTINTVNSQTAT